MNREIKFRVWDATEKEYNYDIVAGNILSAIHGSGDPLSEEEEEQFTLQQYTGCKDKNGKMIFEGDILRQNDLRFEIRFESFQWVAVCPYYNKYHHPRIEHFRLCASGEVIGNIMENPELLKA
jgi:hypothetical protein